MTGATGQLSRSLPAGPRACAVGALRATHLAVALLILTGWAMPWRPVLWAVVVLAAVSQASWLLCNDRCPLTILEERLRGPEAERPLRHPADAAEPANFVVDGLSRLLGRPVPYRLTNLAIYAVTWFAFAVASARLALS